MITHRSRVADKRRARTKSQLIEAAVTIVAQKGVEATTIDDVTNMAKVSRGTFYNYFRLLPDLFEAARTEISTEIARLIEARLASEPDPAVRLARGLSIFLETSRAYPLIGSFSAGLGRESLGEQNLIHDLLARTIAQGIETGRFTDVSLMFAIDMISATMLAVCSRDSAGDRPDPRQIIVVLLRGLGVDHQTALALASNKEDPLTIAPHGLLAAGARAAS